MDTPATCAHCSATFAKRRAWQRYCQRKCATRAAYADEGPRGHVLRAKKRNWNDRHKELLAVQRRERYARRVDIERARALKRYHASDKAVVAARQRAWREQNKQRVQALNRSWYEKNRDKVRAYDRELRYGITREQYDKMVAAQHGVCAICRHPLGNRDTVDHCHSSGRIRGLLCDRCNKGLGFFRDDPTLLKQAIAYLLATGLKVA